MTHDDILYGRLKLWQPEVGPRVKMDTVLLAAYVRLRSRRGASFVELGSATGAVSLMLALRFPERISVIGVEVQQELAEIAERNRIFNSMEDRVSFICGDLRDQDLLKGSSFDGLVVNPPYEASGRGQRSPAEVRAVAREELCCTASDVMKAASRLLKSKGRFFAVFRADRMSVFLNSMTAEGITPKRMRLVHPNALKPADLFLIEGIKDGGEGLIIEPTLIVRDNEGNYTAELLKAYEPEGL